MEKFQSSYEVLSRYFSFPEKMVIDIGCGTGDLVRWLAGQKALVTGIDTIPMLAKAVSFRRSGEERYLVGLGESLPLSDSCADILIYAASLHHVPAGRLQDALLECQRILKPNGQAVFIEPVSWPGSYYDIVRLAEEETEARDLAYMALLKWAASEMKMVSEDFFYVERSFRDFEELVKTHIADESRWPDIFIQARRATEQLALAAGLSFVDYRFRSICRLNILMKTERERS